MPGTEQGPLSTPLMEAALTSTVSLTLLKLAVGWLDYGKVSLGRRLEAGHSSRKGSQ